MKTDVICIYQGQSMEAEMIKEYLADNGIVANIKSQLMSQIAPFQVSGGAASPAEVEVLANDEEQARELLEVFFKA